MLGLKLIHISKKNPIVCQAIAYDNDDAGYQCIMHEALSTKYIILAKGRDTWGSYQ